jgi:hypothetical protein
VSFDLLTVASLAVKQASDVHTRNLSLTGRALDGRCLVVELADESVGDVLQTPFVQLNVPVMFSQSSLMQVKFHSTEKFLVTFLALGTVRRPERKMQCYVKWGELNAN